MYMVSHDFRLFMIYFLGNTSIRPLYIYITLKTIHTDVLPVSELFHFVDKMIARFSDPKNIAIVKRLSNPSLFHIDMDQKRQDVPQESFRKLDV